MFSRVLQLVSFLYEHTHIASTKLYRLSATTKCNTRCLSTYKYELATAYHTPIAIAAPIRKTVSAQQQSKSVHVRHIGK